MGSLIMRNLQEKNPILDVYSNILHPIIIKSRMLNEHCLLFFVTFKIFFIHCTIIEKDKDIALCKYMSVTNIWYFILL